MLEEPKNVYTVHMVSKRKGKVEVEADTAETAIEMADCMDEEDINWSHEEWEEQRAELERRGRHSLRTVIPEVIAFMRSAVDPGNPMLIPDLAVNRLKEMLPHLEATYEEFYKTYEGKRLLDAQEHGRSPFSQ